MLAIKKIVMGIEVVIISKAMYVGRDPQDEVMRPQVATDDIDITFWCVNHQLKREDWKLWRFRSGTPN